MKRYKTTQVVEIYGGRIGMTEKQAAFRMRNLRKIESGIYEVTGFVQLKSGEEIRLDAIDKYLVDRVVCLDESESQEPEEMKPHKSAERKLVSDMTVAELRDEAKRYPEIIGEHSMKKADLAAAVQSQRNRRELINRNFNV